MTQELNQAENALVETFNKLKAGQPIKTKGKSLTLDEGKKLLEK